MAEREETLKMHGFNEALGIELGEVTARQVKAEIRIGPQHHQPWGIVHGGVYCGIVETLCSIGSQTALTPGAGFIVGADNHTSFLKATRSGTLRAVARPLSGGKRTQLWEANIENEQGELVATGRVRLMVVAAGKLLAGEPAAAKPQAD
jgi:1,4-dihydroxy-2-naphthoyl-CoA hydrolase